MKRIKILLRWILLPIVLLLWIIEVLFYSIITKTTTSIPPEYENTLWYKFATLIK